MNWIDCSVAHLQLHPYLDAELSPADALSLEAHLVDCEACRREFEALSAAVETVRGARGLYEVPDTSRERVARLIANHRRRHTLWQMAAVASVLIVGLVFFRSLRDRFAPTDTLAELAVETHLRYARGMVPLDIRSEEPQAVAGWLSVRLPFRLTLPNYPEPPGETKKYVLEGARLLQLSHDDVAFLAYRMDRRPISLLMTASARVAPAGGEVYHSGGLVFHSTLYKGLRVITWTDKGLAYALVSELATGGAESCMVCHGGESEERKFAPLKPQL